MKRENENCGNCHAWIKEGKPIHSLRVAHGDCRRHAPRGDNPFTPIKIIETNEFYWCAEYIDLK